MTETAATLPPPENLLRLEVSPYLVQHAENPVHWRAWGPQAFAEAAALDRPVLLSVGYAACHWCHVMAHESFENPDIAAVMNRLFVNIKVDREERPEIDQIYMNALHTLGEQGGWPLTMFLKPDGAPFWGGTYFPPEPRYGRPGFVQILEAVSEAYRTGADAVRINSVNLVAALSAPRKATSVTLDADTIDRAAAQLLTITDAINGGTQGAPKFPQAPLLELHWRAFRRNGDERHRAHVMKTLERISNGGIYDHIGGGFARYSVDYRWLVPHFEKMLYDNGQLVSLLVQAAASGGDSGFGVRVTETIGWLEREMMAEAGAFAASLDADSEGEEGRFYVWTPVEVAEVLGAEAAGFEAAYDITQRGNFEGRSIPNRLASGFADGEEETRLAPLRARLLGARSARVPPGRDDKVLADWNGLAIAAVAEAGSLFARPEWITLAAGAYRGVKQLLADGPRLGHAARKERRTFPGLSTDHAAMIRAAFALHLATADPSYIDDAIIWGEVLDRHHRLESGAYALAADDADRLIVRLSAGLDEATPSGNAQVAEALTALWLATGNDLYRARVDRLFETFAGEIVSNIFGHAGLLNALDSRINAEQAVVVLPPGSAPGALTDAIRRSPRPGRVVTIVAEDGIADAHPAAGKRAVEGRETVYLCRGATCSLPILTVEALVQALGGTA
ncbi:hypothetical protein SAMN02745172_01927 [Pseudoxanthobacter soli DSM 19599]|uniref:Spermatogenesis-associated protein 20-like TRX domain-containing protein n=1 Tax=Pseudoxanthobacter soli DSM 19599 TaxID=1123029 RepID=A0A1M7ZJH7_9HYPH|nr:thioredoxin domain-containing protein [Pseudoxanthobacter soli]SHO64972.1 hypothetical protein SAMN02745172_01927 [Pseudoxanthobacter soli DSM 19599]